MIKVILSQISNSVLVSVFKYIVLLQFNFDFNCFSHAYMKHWELFSRILVSNESECEELTGISREQFDDHICECLTKADSSPATERNPAVRASFRAFRC